MNKKIYLLLPLIMFVLQAFSEENLTCDLPTKDFKIRDSIKTAEGDYSYYDVKIAIPKKGGAVTAAVCDSIYGWVCKFCNSAYTKKIDQLLKEESKTYFDSYREETGGELTGFAWYFENDIRPVAYCSEYITMNVEGYDYRGGAHGMPFNYCVTFRMSDGHRMLWSDYTDNGEEIRPFINEQLDSEWFGENSSLQPLPYNEPWILGSDIVFHYTPYEIAPFAAGMPEATLHYTNIEKWLKPWVIKACKTFDKEKNKKGE